MNKKYRVRITEEDLEKTRLILMADIPKEGAAFLLAGIRKEEYGEEFIVRRIVEIPKSEYRIQNSCHLEISPKAINGIISLCESNGLGVILCHSHPTTTSYSSSDDFGEKRIAKTVWQFMYHIPVGSLLFTPSDIQGRVWIPNGSREKISTITVIGRCIRILSLDKKLAGSDHIDSVIYDRQVLAFGKEGQDIISRTKVGIVGLGGTGSPTAEQLVRLGVNDLVFIDKDRFDSSNLTRLYGSFYSDAYPKWYNALSWFRKKSKVDLVSNHLLRIKPDIKIKKIKGNVVSSDTCKALLDRDVVFSCTDDHWGRSILNQLSYQYLIPVINMGVRIDSKQGEIKGAAGSIHLLRPGKPCLWCYEFLKSKRINTESLPAQERESLLREGYVENIDNSAPAVISLTTTISGQAVTLFLQLVTDFMGTSGDLSCLQYYIMDGQISRGTRNISSKCVCQSVKGYGDLKPLHTI